MRYRLELKLKPAEGALLRVLGMIERRGFPPHAVHATHDGVGPGSVRRSGHPLERVDQSSAESPLM